MVTKNVRKVHCHDAAFYDTLFLQTIVNTLLVSQMHFLEQNIKRAELGRGKRQEEVSGRNIMTEKLSSFHSNMPARKRRWGEGVRWQVR